MQFKKLFKPILIGFVAVVGLGLTISALVMLNQHSQTVHELSKSQAMLNTEQVGQKVIDNINVLNKKTAELAGKMNVVVNEETLDEFIGEVTAPDSEVKRFRYFVNDYMYDELHTPSTKYGSQDLAFAYREAGKLEPAYLGSYTDTITVGSNEPIEHFEFYSSVSECSYFIDGISVYYNVETIEALADASTFHADSSFSVLCSNKWVIYGNKETESFKRDTNDFLSNLRTWVGDKTVTDEVTKVVNSKTSGAVFCQIGNKDYVVSIYCNSQLSNLCVCELYSCDVLNPSNRSLINSIVSVFVIFVIIIVATILYFLIDHARLSRKITNSETQNAQLSCLNRYGFEKEAEQIFIRQKDSYFGIIICEIKHFKYLSETFGEQEVFAILRHIKTVSSKIEGLEETYAYTDNGEFLLLLHAKDKEDLISRLKMHSFLTSQYKGSSKDAHISLKYGIYEHIQNETTSVSKMIDYAREANNAIVKATVENVDMQFNFYNDDLRKIRLINEDMELRQEQALRDGEFQVFYQAKYNLKAERQDGAEALVRWYDKDSGVYNVPALFMPLFESNGFIEKLDKYVYSKVCEYISYSIANGRHVFPVSVNVSRITATQPDFIDYYSRLKKKFGIANGAITIEFTESFAYENYDVLHDIVNKLHANGFQCSIDDFGCGYSSYRILKELPMDEIKLDKFFIDHTTQPERIEKIYESIITLAKDLNMKVTQEGVETKEDVEILKKHKCDVVQGYIYSKPISLTDYLHFCEESRLHKL